VLYSTNAWADILRGAHPQERRKDKLKLSCQLFCCFHASTHTLQATWKDSRSELLGKRAPLSAALTTVVRTDFINLNCSCIKQTSIILDVDPFTARILANCRSYSIKIAGNFSGDAAQSPLVTLILRNFLPAWA